MRDKIRFGNSTIIYTVTKSKRRKTSQIIVDSKGIEVKVPITKRDSEIRKMVSNKKEWIFKKQLEFSDKKTKKISINKKTPEYLEKRTWELASKLGIKPIKVIIKDYKSQWGSATKSGIIRLNKKLANTPKRIIDYIIIHELYHLKHYNHSSKFWDLLYLYDKKYQEKIDWLENHSKILLK